LAAWLLANHGQARGSFWVVEPRPATLPAALERQPRRDLRAAAAPAVAIVA
jgi:hypothetical protein